jgi:predicted negative regulator of RcsB-dependent stress response
MKRTERHKLKENEFARSVARARTVMDERRSDITKAVVAFVILIAAVGGYAWWSLSRDARANAALATALATYEMPVVPPEPPKPGSPPPVPRPGTFQSQREKLEASLPKFLDAANAYPGSKPGIAARFHAAGILAELGRHPEAEQRYKEVVDKAGDTIYGTTARLGMAEAQVAQKKYDAAIAIYSELSRDTNSTLPLDSVLMHLGRAYARAGKKEEAVRSFTRVFEEFPQSAYAADARREMEETKKRS